MKAEIANKPDEQFPSDEDGDMLKAGATPPANPARAKAAPVAFARPLKAASPGGSSPGAPRGLLPVSMQVQPSGNPAGGNQPGGNQPIKVVVEIPEDEPPVRQTVPLEQVADRPGGGGKASVAVPQH